LGAENNPQAGRIDSLSLTGSVIHARQAEIARLEVLDNGKPFSEAEWDVAEAAGCFDLYAGLAKRRCPGAPSGRFRG
jgi:betaine-aldehyde dehydrogenase